MTREDEFRDVECQANYGFVSITLATYEERSKYKYIPRSKFLERSTKYMHCPNQKIPNLMPSMSKRNAAYVDSTQ